MEEPVSGAHHCVRQEPVGNAEAGLEVVPLPAEWAPPKVAVIDESKPSHHTEVRRRELGYRVERVIRAGLRFDRTGLVEGEAAGQAVEALGHGRLELVTQTDVHGPLRAQLEIVVQVKREEGVLQRKAGRARHRPGGDTEQERRKLLADRRRRRVVELAARVGVGEIEVGKGTIGKLLVDESLYNSLTNTVNQVQLLATTLNSRTGTIGPCQKGCAPVFWSHGESSRTAPAEKPTPAR